MGAAITRQYMLASGAAAGARALVLQSAGLSTAVAGLLVATAGAWSPLLLGRPSSPELLLALVACLGGAWMVLAQSYLRGADRPGSFVALAMIASLAGPAVGLAVALTVQRSALAYLSGLAGGYALAGIVGLVLVLRSGRPQAARGGLREALRVGVPTIPHQISLYLALAGLVVIADRLLGEGGRANVALTLGAGATVVTAGLNNAWAPVVYRTAPLQRGRVLDETTRAVAVVTLVVAGAIALLAPWLLRLAAPDSFDTTSLVPVVALASAAAVPSVFYLASGHLIFARGTTAWLAVTTPTAVGVGLVLSGVLAPAWGLVAIGGGYVVVYLALAGITTMLQRHVAEHPWWPPFLPITGAAWVLLTVAGALGPVTGTLALLRPLAVVAAVTLGAVVARRLLRGARTATSSQPIR
jgi:O-antigen/teichoic acid export membrane protein